MLFIQYEAIILHDNISKIMFIVIIFWISLLF